MLGFAWQEGLVPISLSALLRAIELNSVAVERNKQAFAWGRIARADPDFLPKAARDVPTTETLDELIVRRSAFLAEYQNRAYAARFEAMVARVRHAESASGSEALTEAVARSLFKLMAYKDEYEVARLYTDGRFEQQLRDQFEGDIKISFNLAPPLLSSGVDALGRPKKRAIGAWLMPVFRTMAKLRFLRGTALDIFGHSADRKLERELIAAYEKDVAAVIGALSPATIDTAVELLSLPDRIRGYGPVKEKAAKDAAARHAQLKADLANPPPAPRQIAAE
jgi:indolepyruvate ferredoxin oxidoreductase